MLQTDRRQTDGRRHIAIVNLSSRSLKMAANRHPLWLYFYRHSFRCRRWLMCCLHILDHLTKLARFAPTCCPPRLWNSTNTISWQVMTDGQVNCNMRRWTDSTLICFLLRHHILARPLVSHQSGIKSANSQLTTRSNHTNGGGLVSGSVLLLINDQCKLTYVKPS